jgi:2-phosphoglycerate kinase
MVRFQIYLKDEQAKLLADLAREQHIPKAELIREGIDMVIRRRISEQEDPLLSLIGQAGFVGRSDISEEHDAYLASRMKRRS